MTLAGAMSALAKWALPMGLRLAFLGRSQGTAGNMRGTAGNRRGTAGNSGEQAGNSGEQAGNSGEQRGTAPFKEFTLYLRNSPFL